MNNDNNFDKNTLNKDIDKNRNKNKRKKPKMIKNKIAWLELLFTGAILIVAFRLIYLNFFQAKQLRSQAENQITGQDIIKAKRGSILDRNGNVLAQSAQSYKITADLMRLRRIILPQQSNYENPTPENEKKISIKVEEIANVISPYLNLSKEEVYNRMMKKYDSGSFVPTANLGEKFDIATLKDFNMMLKEKKYSWLIVDEDTKRYYPNQNLAAQVIGAIGNDNIGKAGAELQFNEYLQGVNGLKISQKDQSQNDILLNEPIINPAVNGNDVVLTIDENIQKISEKVAKDALEESKAKGVIIVVSNPKNGEILSMVNYPSFDPNKPFDVPEGKDFNELWKNRAISDVYEPGSTFKIVTMSAALNENVAKLSDTFYCPGYIMIGKDRINCAVLSGHGHETLTDLMKNSCNPGFVTLGQRLGVIKFVEYVKKFKTDQKLGIDLPGEAGGLIIDPNKASALDLGTASIGQTNATTALHLINNLNVIINKGMMTTPHILKRIEKNNGDGSKETVLKYQGKESERIVSEDTAKKVFDMLVETAKSGGSVKARVDGYTVLGKTGTAQKIDPATGKYGKYVASFVGAAPAEDPKFSIYIAVDEPEFEYHMGGAFAAPKGKILFEEILKYMESGRMNQGD